MKPRGTTTAATGGTVVIADVRDPDEEDEVLARKIRMLSVEGAEPETEVKKLAKGKMLHVLGIPRVWLKLVQESVDAGNSEEVSGHLPYEMIIVAGVSEE